ncbi:MAG: hypothetical protein HQK50_03795 [Oligoflexia bacterium]|nr:hypothetical protein [Oligoflexia bacterium]MBF0364667.1 hypothetical protein [Oligoflexia bacterium]
MIRRILLLTVFTTVFVNGLCASVFAFSEKQLQEKIVKLQGKIDVLEDRYQQKCQDYDRIASLIDQELLARLRHLEEAGQNLVHRSLAYHPDLQQQQVFSKLDTNELKMQRIVISSKKDYLVRHHFDDARIKALQDEIIELEKEINSFETIDLD